MSKINNIFHRKSKLQKRVITQDNFTYRNIIPLLKKFVLRDNRVIDFGCGVGTVDFYLNVLGANVLGIDDSEVAIDLAKKNATELGLNRNITFIKKV